MPNTVKATCPKCSKTASSYTEVEKAFGWRNPSVGGKFPQSHCRDCRAEALTNKKPKQ